MLAGTAGQLGSNEADHLEVAGHVAELFVYILAERAQRLAAAQALADGSRGAVATHGVALLAGVIAVVLDAGGWHAGYFTGHRITTHAQKPFLRLHFFSHHMQCALVGLRQSM